MEHTEKKAALKQIVDGALGVSSSFVEETLTTGEYKLYTEVWSIALPQLDKIRSKVNLLSLYVDGGRITLIAKY